MHLERQVETIAIQSIKIRGIGNSQWGNVCREVNKVDDCLYNMKTIQLGVKNE